jgi:hypothetical protein
MVRLQPGPKKTSMSTGLFSVTVYLPGPRVTKVPVSLPGNSDGVGLLPVTHTIRLLQRSHFVS